MMLDLKIRQKTISIISVFAFCLSHFVLAEAQHLRSSTAEPILFLLLATSSLAHTLTVVPFALCVRLASERSALFVCSLVRSFVSEFAVEGENRQTSGEYHAHCTVELNFADKTHRRIPIIQPASKPADHPIRPSSNPAIQPPGWRRRQLAGGPPLGSAAVDCRESPLAPQCKHT